MAVDSYFKANRRRWDELVPFHVGSEFYAVERFRQGGSSLWPLEVEELGDVRGKRLLHLQCHFGLDTLSWARLGARVTGVDFSGAAIEQARSLSAELGIPAEFVCSNVYELPKVLQGQFDVVFTSYGVLVWLPDLTRWAHVIAHFLAPGGVFYIAEQHPLLHSWPWERETTSLVMRDPYFHLDEPERSDDGGSYAGPAAPLTNRTDYEWRFSLGDVVSALAGAGLRIEFLHEHPFCTWRRWDFLEPDDQGRWWLPGELRDKFPLTFSLKGRGRCVFRVLHTHTGI